LADLGASTGPAIEIAGRWSAAVVDGLGERSFNGAGDRDRRKATTRRSRLGVHGLASTEPAIEIAGREDVMRQVYAIAVLQRSRRSRSPEGATARAALRSAPAGFNGAGDRDRRKARPMRRSSRSSRC